MSAPFRLYSLAIVLLVILLMVPAISLPGAAVENEAAASYDYHYERTVVDMTSPLRSFLVDELMLDTTPGAPALPLESLLLALPPGQRLVDVKVRHSDPTFLEFIENYPCNSAVVPLSGGEPVTEEAEIGAWTFGGSYFLEGVEVACIDLRPLSWEPSTGRVELTTDYTIILQTVPDDLGFIGDLDRVRELVDNPEAVPETNRNILSDLLPSGYYQHIIITDEALTAPFQALAEWKGERNDLGSTHGNVASIVVTLQEIRNISELWGDPASHGGKGNDTQTLVRNFIRAAYQEWGVSYVLLGGDDDVLPCRKIWASAGGYTDQLPADIYFTGLDGDWDDDGDGSFGEPFGVGTQGEEADLLAEVYVGRATVSTISEAWTFVNKTILYEKGYVAQYGDDLLFVGELLNSNPMTWGADYKQEVYQEVLTDEGLSLTTIYQKDGTFSRNIFLEQMDSGVHIINHMGHGNYEAFADLSINDVTGLQNQLPFILYTQACMVAGFDEKTEEPGDCIAEEFIKEEGGAVALIGNSRYGWYAPGSTDGASQMFDISFFGRVYDDDVRELGRALSWSKEEHVNYATSSGTVRWVYLELNLLGDPETAVLTTSNGDHDLTAKKIVADQCVWNEECQVSVQVQNLGQFSEIGTVRLLADDILVTSSTVSLIPGESAWVEMSWTPLEYRPYDLKADITSTVDDLRSNDMIALTVVVDRRLTMDELWDEEDRNLPGGIIVDPGVTLEVRNSTVSFLPLTIDYQMKVRGTLRASGSTFGGSPFSLISAGELDLVDCQLTAMAEESASEFVGGSLSLTNTSVHGGAGWQINDTVTSLEDTMFTDQTSAWSIANSVLELGGSDGTGGFGLHLSNVRGAVRNLTWTGGGRGLTVERCTGLTLHHLSLFGNQVDVDILGDQDAHFLHDLDEVNLTYGQLIIVDHANGIVLENGTGSLYLVDCHDVTVKGWMLRNAGHGLGLISSTGIVLIGNAIENCSIGVLAQDSGGVVWSNDLIGNDRHVKQVRSLLSYGQEYPIGGNHWSDQSGVDLKSGPGQDQPGSDGMADMPYVNYDVLDRYSKVARCSIVHDSPSANFTRDVEVLDIVSAVTFSDTSASGSGIGNWTWDLGDGTVAYGPRVSHLYSTKGMVTVILTVMDHKGMTDSTSRDLDVINHRPECDFGYSPFQPSRGETISFQDLSLDLDGGIFSWHWDLGDGNYTSSPSFEHSYFAPGDYFVNLTVTDAEGGSDLLVRKVAVGNNAPVADFSWAPAFITSLQNVDFSSDCTDQDGQVVSWSWDFGDGTTGSGSSVVHRFTKIGTYQVQLTATDDDGATNIMRKSLVVNNARPTAAFESVLEVMSMVEVQFKDRSFDPDGTIKAWDWDFGDGVRSTASSPSHAFAGPGTYNVTLTVRDNLGSVGTATKVVTVVNRPPVTAIRVAEGDRYSLDPVELIGEGTDVDGNVTAYQWDLGDGSQASGSMVSHAYTAPGDYTIVLTTTDDAGGISTNSTIIEILNLAPEASVVVQPGSEHPRDRTFISEARDLDGHLVGFNWSFGDGSFGTGETCSHRYDDDGEFLVELSVTDDQGCRANITVRLTVWTGDLSMENASCVQRDGGWVFTAELVNDGTVPVEVVLRLNVSGSEINRSYLLEAGERRTVELSLEAFEKGAITATLILPEGWDRDTGDNSWNGSVVSNDEGSPLTLFILLGLLAVVAIAVTVFLLRRR